MGKHDKSRKDVSEAIGVSYFTFSDWRNGKKYPRIEKLKLHFDIAQKNNIIWSGKVNILERFLNRIRTNIE